VIYKKKACVGITTQAFLHKELKGFYLAASESSESAGAIGVGAAIGAEKIAGYSGIGGAMG
jgi:hypothetical protein